MTSIKEPKQQGYASPLDSEAGASKSLKLSEKTFKQAYRLQDQNLSATCKMLGISRMTAYNRFSHLIEKKLNHVVLNNPETDKPYTLDELSAEIFKQTYYSTNNNLKATCKILAIGRSTAYSRFGPLIRPQKQNPYIFLQNPETDERYTLDELAEEIFKRTYQATENNITAASERLGIGRTTAYNRFKHLAPKADK